MDNLKALMGESYHDGITVEEVDAFFSKGKFVDLGSGKYVDKAKFDRVEGDLNALKESTKDYETLKTENENFKAEKADASLKENLVKYGIDPDSFKYVKGDVNEKVLVLSNDEAKDKKAVEDYLKTHPQFAKKVQEDKGGNKKIITTKVENQNEDKVDMNKQVNENFRRALGKKTSTD